MDSNQTSLDSFLSQSVIGHVTLGNDFSLSPLPLSHLHDVRITRGLPEIIDVGCISNLPHGSHSLNVGCSS